MLSSILTSTQRLLNIYVDYVVTRVYSSFHCGRNAIGYRNVYSAAAATSDEVDEARKAKNMRVLELLVLCECPRYQH